MKYLLPLLLFATACNGQIGEKFDGPVAVSIQPADQAMIPWSTRSVYAKVDGTSNLNVTWTVDGGCTLAKSTTNAAPEIVIAPAQGGKCMLTRQPATNEHPSLSSPVMCHIKATSVADPSRSAGITIPVCAPQVELSTFPESTVLFQKQFAVIQSDLRGSVNTNISWAITSNPGNAGELIGGATNRHAVFTANAPGTYVLTATSLADAQKKASTTIYVTANTLPAPNADHTEPIDCTQTGKGIVYEVGPARQYHDLNAVPWLHLKPGALVRIHNDDTTGSAPTTYHQHITIAAGGTPTQPLRVCGVSDAQGVKPIIDGENASSPKDLDWARTYLENLGIVMLYDGVHKWDTKSPGNENVLIEGLHIRNGSPSAKFLQQSDGSPQNYDRGVSCIHVHTGQGVLIRGNDLENCGQPVFSNSQLPEGSLVTDLTIEGNYLHNWGVPDYERNHGMYLQAIGLTVQFNYFAEAAPKVPGNVIKSRSVLNFLRWNYIAPATSESARAFDLVEPQNYVCYVIPHSYAEYHRPGNRSDCYPPHDGPETDPFTADMLAANFEAYHSDYVYGNIMDDNGSESAFVHYGYDQQTEHGPFFDRRGGTLYYWNNTHLTHNAKDFKRIFDPSAPDTGHSYEFPSIESVNNVFASSDSSVYLWTMPLWSRIVVNTNWISPGTLLPNRDADDTYQGGVPPADRSGCGMFNRCKPSNGHMEWMRNGKLGTSATTLYVGPTPFDLHTYQPDAKIRGIGAPLPIAIQNQPSNMQYFPATGIIAPRKDASVLGALD